MSKLGRVLTHAARSWLPTSSWRLSSSWPPSTSWPWLQLVSCLHSSGGTQTPSPTRRPLSAIFTSLLNTEYVNVETNVFVLNISSYDSVLKLFSFLSNLRNKLFMICLVALWQWVADGWNWSGFFILPSWIGSHRQLSIVWFWQVSEDRFRFCWLKVI